ncbi:hypothetical protein with Ribonuclease H-like superfamily domain [Klebsormidium nitens]|uniref:Integrase catalytic domain-containing protein n=1 Tax=Klebsormidium nitens TaxID=105231 RepID=A0A1Y1ISL8_KLENI|nr:hypothetical protein with Ribonuclease H-like superfamily domain [Klebsormidium nitens]|eukprot:GAQ93042.1 hypothetical protein with Ribonuclease H-like superfamily domain [Klebsormidium nitens]
MVLEKVHNQGGHPSISKTRKLLQSRFFWKGMYEDVRDFIKSCVACQFANQPTTERTDGRKLTSTEVDLPLEKVGFDLLGPFPPTTEGYEYVYIWYDYFSGWIGAGLGRTKQSAEVAKFLKMDLFAAHACPALIIMDNDAHVGEVKDLCQRMGTQVQVIVPYSPWMNGGAESSPVLPAERLLAARFRISQSSTSEGEERAEREFDAAVQGICEIRRVDILLRQAHQANMRATAAANRDISQVRAEAAYQRR